MADFSKLQKIAASQHGLFTARQAVSCGYQKHAHSVYCSREKWIHAGRGIFRLPEFDEGSFEARCTLFSLWSRNLDDQPQGIISHQTALALYGLDDFQQDEIHLTVPKSFRKKVIQGCKIHKDTLSLSTIESRGCLLVTRPTRTMADLRECLSAEEWERVLDRLTESGKISAAEAASLSGQDAPSQPVTTSTPDATEKQGSQNVENNLATETNGLPDEKHITKDSLTEGVWQMIFNNTATGRRTTAGFTLVELLVVIAIISILAAMLMPALQKAMKSARAIACASQFSQIGKAMVLYADDNSDLPPRVASYESTGYFWFRALEIPGYCGSPTPKANISSARRGTLFTCPDDEDPYEVTAALGWGKQQFVSYGLSVHVAGRPAEEGYYREDWLTFAQIDRLAKRTSGTVLVTDTSGHYALYSHAYANNDPFADDPPQYFVAPRHTRTANFLFADIHVKAIAAPFGAPGVNSDFLYPNVAADLRR